MEVRRERESLAKRKHVEDGKREEMKGEGRVRIKQESRATLGKGGGMVGERV